MTDEKKTYHSPIEDALNISPGTTELPSSYYNREQSSAKGELVSKDDEEVPDFDDEYNDQHAKVKDDLQQIFTNAMAAFEEQQALIHQIDPKLAARNAEVAAQYLKIALDSTSERRKVKDDREKLKQSKRKGRGSGEGGINMENSQAVFVGDRNELFKLMKDLKKGQDEE